MQTHDEPLRQASAAIAQAVRALNEAKAYRLADEAYALANRVLQARQAAARAVTTEAR